MFAEDLIADFASKVKISKDDSLLAEMLRADDWTRGFIQSLNKSVEAGRALSTEQSRVFVNIVRRYYEHGILRDSGYRHEALENFIAAPRHRQPPYPSTNIPKEVRYLGDNRFGFRSKWIDAIVHDIKALANKGSDASWKEFQRPYWSRQARMWVVSVTADNYDAVMKIIGRHGFDYDDAVAEYLALAANSKGEKSTFIYDPESEKIVANICDNDILDGWIKRIVFGEIL